MSRSRDIAVDCHDAGMQSKIARALPPMARIALYAALALEVEANEGWTSHINQQEALRANLWILYEAYRNRHSRRASS